MQAELQAREERLEAMGRLLEQSRGAGEEASSQLQDASQERWELQLQARLKSEQAEAYEARLRYLQDEVGTKQERLRRVTQEAEHAQAMLRKQQATMAEGEQALQRMRTVELPSLRDELRREASRAASSRSWF